MFYVESIKEINFLFIFIFIIFFFWQYLWQQQHCTTCWTIQQEAYLSLQ